MNPHKYTLMERIENFLRSTSGMFISLIMVLAFSTPNTTEVLSKIARLPYIDPSQMRLMALSFALVIEFVILILATIGQQRGAKIYAIASFIFHLLYYHRWDELLIADYTNPLLVSEVYTNFIASIVTSFMISGSIWYFSDQLGIMIEQKSTYTNLNKEIDLIREHIERDEWVLNELQQSVDKKQQELTAIEHTRTTTNQKINIAETAFVRLNKEYQILESKKVDLENEIVSLRKSKAGSTPRISKQQIA